LEGVAFLLALPRKKNLGYSLGMLLGIFLSCASVQAKTAKPLEDLIEEPLELPVDVLMTIFDSLKPSAADLMSLGQVNASYREAAKRLLVEVLRDSISKQEFKSLIGHDVYTYYAHGELAHEALNRMLYVLQSASAQKSILPEQIAAADEAVRGGFYSRALSKDGDIIFSPYDPEIFFFTFRTQKGHELWLFEQGVADLIYISKRPIQTIFFVGENGDVALIVDQSGKAVLFEGNRLTPLGQELGEIADTFRFARGRSSTYQIAVTEKGLKVWGPGEQFPQTLELDLGLVPAIVQQPNRPDRFLMISKVNCETHYVDLAALKVLHSFTDQMICDARFVESPKYANEFFGLEKKWHLNKGRIESQTYLNMISLTGFQPKHVSRVDNWYATQFVNDFNSLDELALFDDQNSQLLIWDLDTMSLKQKFDPQKKGFFASIFAAPEFYFMRYAHSSRNPKFIFWAGLAIQGGPLKVLSVTDQEVNYLTINPENGTKFTHFDMMAIHPLNTDLVLLRESSGLSFYHLGKKRLFSQISNDTSIFAYAINPYFPSRIVAFGDKAYVWNWYRE
jgi:hypothetical protein